MKYDLKLVLYMPHFKVTRVKCGVRFEPCVGKLGIKQYSGST